MKYLLILILAALSAFAETPADGFRVERLTPGEVARLAAARKAVEAAQAELDSVEGAIKAKRGATPDNYPCSGNFCYAVAVCSRTTVTIRGVYALIEEKSTGQCGGSGAIITLARGN